MPNPGDIINGSHIGKRLRDKYIYQACKLCGAERWVRIVRGEPRSTSCKTCQRNPQNAPNYKGQKLTWNGYRMVKLAPTDFFWSMAHSDGYVREHRLVMAKHLGRCLHIWEIVHHKNGNKLDNRIENLQLVTDDRHKQITALEQRIKNLEARVISLEVENITLRKESKEVAKDERNTLYQGSG